MTEYAVRELDLRTLGPLVSRGIATLVSRTVALQLVTLAGMVVLMRVLGPREFGVFAIMQTVLALVQIFADVGVAGALIRQPEAPSARQLSSVLYLQAGAASALMVIVIAIASPLLRLWPDLPADAPWLLRVLALDFVIASMRLPPMLLLERRLQFGRIAAMDVAGSIAYYATAVSLALAGFGVWALIGGVLGQALLVTIAAYAITGWRPILCFDAAALAPLLRFGVAQQTRNVLAMISESVTPFWGGRMLGITAVGLVNWSRQTAYFCLRAVDIVGRVGFPLFARLQHDRARLGESLGRAIHLCAFVTLGWVAICVALGGPITRWIFSTQWVPAVPYLIVFACAMTIGFVTPIAAVALDAIGRPGVVARASVGWTIWNWVAVVVATARWHTLGFTIGYASHVVAGNIAMLIIVHRALPATRLWLRFRAPAAGAVITAAVSRLVLLPHVGGLVTLTLAIAATIACYGAIVFAIDGRALARALSIVPADPDDLEAVVVSAA